MGGARAPPAPPPGYATAFNTSITIGNGIDLVLSSRGEITLQKLFWVIVVKVNAYNPMPSHPVRSMSLHSTPSGFDIYDIKLQKRFSAVLF